MFIDKRIVKDIEMKSLHEIHERSRQLESSWITAIKMDVARRGRSKGRDRVKAWKKERGRENVGRHYLQRCHLSKG